MSFGIIMSPHRKREMKEISPKSWSGMHTETNQPGSAAAGSVRMGTDDTVLIERVELSSFVAAGDRLLVHLNSF